MRNMKREWIRIGPMLVLSLALSAINRAQDTTPPPAQPGQQEQQPANDPANPGQPTPAGAVAPAGALGTGTPVPAGRVVPWLGTASPLRWGDFSIGNFTYQQVSDHFQPVGNVPSANIALSILRTSVIFDHYFGKHQLLLQYEPQLAVLNGKVAGNAGLDNDLNLGWTFLLTPRLTMVVKDMFADVHSRQLYPANYLGIDQQAGNLIQNNFLQNAGSYWTNQVTGVITYLISPRLMLTLSPSYKYTHATNDQEVLFLANGHDISDAAALTYALTQRQTIGAVYTLELLREKDAAGILANSYFHTVGFYYANRLSQSWWLQGQLGANLARYPNDIPPVTTVAGTLSLIKTFTTGNFAIGYSRGRVENANFLTARTGDLVQASYTQHLGKRLTWNNGAGYYRESGADPRNMGNLLATGVDLEIRPNLFLTGSYSHMFQKSSTLQLLSGTRNTYIFGLKWAPQPAKMH